MAGLLIAGCGSDEPGSDRAGTATRLTLTLEADGPGGEASQTGELSCGGEAETPACSLVDELPEDPAAPTPPGTACTEIYGGPDTLRVEGTLRGDAIDAQLTRGNGCEIERFDQFLPLIQELFPGYRPGSAIAG